MKKFILFFYILAAVLPSFLFIPTGTAEAGSCVINSVAWNPAGKQAANWFVEGKTRADVIVKSTGCKGQVVLFSIEAAHACPLVNCDSFLTNSKLHDRQLQIPSDNFTVNLQLGEEGCNNNSVNSSCDLYIYIKDANGDQLADSYSDDTSGNLFYNCAGVCDVNATFLGITVNGSNDPAHDVNADNKAAVVAGDSYTPLAPIGTTGTGTLTSIKTSDIGAYLRNIFLLAIGLCGALAVIMIIIASIQYMGNESVFGKTEAKSRIFSSIGGLFIALSAFALLNTINPDLTGANGVSISQVTAEIDPDTETTPPLATYTAGDSKQCQSGFVDVPTYGVPSKINVCSTINGIPVAANLKSMIDTAKASGIILTGSGSRSYARQVELRTSHHCTDIYNAPASTCTPPTARPGHSNHEIGGAVDFDCGTDSIGDHSNRCYVWLSANAGRYQFYNLASEPWHWSFNGK